MTLLRILETGDATSIAIGGGEASSITFAALRERIHRISESLFASGIRPSDRLVMVLSNSSQAAVTLLGAMSYCAAAPLNPNLSEGEFESLLADLRPAAIVAPGNAAALAAASRQQVRTIDLNTEVRINGSVPAPDDDSIALLLHTSGTTSKPKLVPLTQRNLCESAANIGRTLQLAPSDRCFNVMPLFHVHGLIGALLSSLAAGASCVCPGKFEPLRFMRQLRDSGATWYTAVPSIHQSILRSDVPAPQLRFVRSCSSHLATPLWRQVEQFFDTPVVNCYGMSEASHQITSGRRAGTVGEAGATEAAVMNDEGSLLPVGSRGEVVIRGAAVMAGYLGNAEVNRSAFCGGWLRTGDEGSLDRDGFLKLLGRLKEIINRAGEKISPFEVDEVFLGHPAVSQAVAFPVPHRTLGEEVGLAVVLRPGQTIEKRQLLNFGGERLSRFKLPTQVWVLPEIPKGPTGKIQRNSLAARLAGTAQ